MEIDRREFIKAAAGTAMFADTLLTNAETSPIRVRDDRDSVTVAAAEYTWRWSPTTDVFQLEDKHGRVITEGPLQPIIVVRDGHHDSEWSSEGEFLSKSVQGNRVTVSYAGVNGDSRVTVTWRFDEDSLWFDPVSYETTAPQDVVSVHYFSKHSNQEQMPGLQYSYLIQPGISMTSFISPIVPALNRANLISWLGHGGGNTLSTFQQWGLPSHYFCLCHSGPSSNAKSALTEHLSDAVCIGLADVPAADLYLQISGKNCSPITSMRSDLWGNARGPGSFKLGPTFYCAIGENYREAIRAYYLGLVRAGIIKTKINSPRKNAIVTASAFDTWGAEVATEEWWGRFNEGLCEQVYQDLTSAGMESDIFVIDAKWEGKYGTLTHSQEQFPHFEAFLARLRSDGHKVGLWAAFLRCEDPASLGLRPEHMLRGPDGRPFIIREAGSQYYLLDVTQPDTERALTKQIQGFMQRYRPDLVKFDFGYELPPLSAGAPKDLNWAGERLFLKTAQVIVAAMRSVNPDVAVMYYSLSPLLINEFDLHSPDDMYACGEDYALEANRRFFFSSLLGEIGMPTYGSAGYDWLSVRDIWFDTVVTGSLGSLGSFTGDERDGRPSPELVAKYNGLAAVARRSNVFRVEPLDPVLVGSVTGGHSSSWARHENGNVVLVALRETNLIGGEKGPGHYRDLVQSDCSVVVASMGTEGIDRSRRLGIVPYSDGEVSVRHAEASTAKIRTHVFGHEASESTMDLKNGRIELQLRERLANGDIVSWIEVELT